MQAICTAKPHVFGTLEELQTFAEGQDVQETESFKLMDFSISADGVARANGEEFVLTDIGLRDAMSLAKLNKSAWETYGEESHDVQQGMTEFVNTYYAKSTEATRDRKLITRRTTPEEREQFGDLERAVIAIPSPSYFLLRHEAAIETFRQKANSCTALRRARIWGNSLEVCLVDRAMKAQATDVGDVVEIGVQFRNSLDRSLAFGASAFTERLWCTNGCHSTHPEFSVSRKHLRSLGDINGDFSSKILEILDKANHLLEALPRLNTLSVDKEFVRWLKPRLIQAITTKPAQKYLEDLELKGNVTRMNVWNNLTEMAHKDPLPVPRQLALEQVGFEILTHSLQ